MTLDHVLGLVAVLCFVAALLGKDDGRGVPAGLIFVTLLLIF